MAHSSFEDEFWIPLVDEPIGGLVDQVQQADPEIERLVASPRRMLAFRTFAYIRIGVLLGQLLVEEDVELGDTATWVEQVMSNPEHRKRVEREVRAVAEEIAADPRYAEEEPLGPDDGVRERFREFWRQHRLARG
jgi:hypothetical protein